MFASQELKVQVVDKRLVNRIWKLSPVDWCGAPVEGSSGGLVVMRNSAKLVFGAPICERNFILLKGSVVATSKGCNLVNVYAPATPQGRRSFWPQLRDTVGFLEGRWCFGVTLIVH